MDIKRLNELSAKKRNEGLSEVEENEHNRLKKEYIENIKSNLTMQLENTYIVDENGNKKKLEKKK